MMDTRIAAVMLVHNRKDLTLLCLDSLQTRHAPRTTLDAFVLDDASTDGTADAVLQRHPRVRVIRGGGQHYWNGGSLLLILGRSDRAVTEARP